jgi:hypothetical protein
VEGQDRGAVRRRGRKNAVYGRLIDVLHRFRMGQSEKQFIERGEAPHLRSECRMGMRNKGHYRDCTLGFPRFRVRLSARGTDNLSRTVENVTALSTGVRSADVKARASIPIRLG